jgi:hypothetical protein
MPPFRSAIKRALHLQECKAPVRYVKNQRPRYSLLVLQSLMLRDKKHLRKVCLQGEVARRSVMPR